MRAPRGWDAPANGPNPRTLVDVLVPQTNQQATIVPTSPSICGADLSPSAGGRVHHEAEACGQLAACHLPTIGGGPERHSACGNEMRRGPGWSSRLGSGWRRRPGWGSSGGRRCRLRSSRDGSSRDGTQLGCGQPYGSNGPIRRIETTLADPTQDSDWTAYENANSDARQSCQYHEKNQHGQHA